jgi:hypothetical protein
VRVVRLASVPQSPPAQRCSASLVVLLIVSLVGWMPNVPTRCAGARPAQSRTPAVSLAQLGVKVLLVLLVRFPRMVSLATWPPMLPEAPPRPTQPPGRPGQRPGGAQVGAPGVKPATPGVKPATPGATAPKPATPGAAAPKPATPGAAAPKPATPAPKPAAPAAKPAAAKP